MQREDWYRYHMYKESLYEDMLANIWLKVGCKICISSSLNVSVKFGTKWSDLTWQIQIFKRPWVWFESLAMFSQIYSPELAWEHDLLTKNCIKKKQVFWQTKRQTGLHDFMPNSNQVLSLRSSRRIICLDIIMKTHCQWSLMNTALNL